MDPVSEYKQILRSVLEQRPSGTRNRLADELGKNRSFISQISNSSYSVPIPARHLSTIFEVCHFSPQEKEHFLNAYHAAHPKKKVKETDLHKTRTLVLKVPDMESKTKNAELDRIVNRFAADIAQLIRIK